MLAPDQIFSTSHEDYNTFIVQRRWTLILTLTSSFKMVFSPCLYKCQKNEFSALWKLVSKCSFHELCFGAHCIKSVNVQLRNWKKPLKQNKNQKKTLEIKFLGSRQIWWEHTNLSQTFGLFFFLYTLSFWSLPRNSKKTNISLKLRSNLKQRCFQCNIKCAHNCAGTTCSWSIKESS